MPSIPTALVDALSKANDFNSVLAALQNALTEPDVPEAIGTAVAQLRLR